MEIANKDVRLLQEEKYTESLALLNKALKLNPNHIEILCNKGLCLMKLDRYDEAISVDSSNFLLHYSKGFLLYNMRKYNKAIDCLWYAIKPNPDFAPAWHYKGKSHEILGDSSNADMCQGKCIELMK